MPDDIIQSELDDGATEVVEKRPPRAPKAPKLGETVRRRPGNRFWELGERYRREFVIMRTQHGAVKATLPHMGVYGLLWRLWAQKRAAGVPDPGVTAKEIITISKKENVNAALEGLLKAELVRCVMYAAAAPGPTKYYYPTPDATKAYALAETLGYGNFVQVGRQRNAWKGRNLDEPKSVFDFAALLQGQMPRAREDT